MKLISYLKWTVVLAMPLGLFGCGYRYYAGPLEPLDESRQISGSQVFDDGTVTYSMGRLEISLRPMTDEELNRQFESDSQSGARSTNPYTFGNSQYWALRETPQRFTVMNLRVKNYEFAKMQLDPSNIFMTTGNGREYSSLSLQQLDTYYRIYAIGYRGNEFAEYDQRRDILDRTMFPPDPIFSGLEEEGYVIFERLHDDVKEIKVLIKDIVLRFDFRGEPAETADVEFFFQRETGKVYKDGRKVVKN